MYILTGSSTPKKDEVTHSGTGRIARVHLRPMGLFETGDSNGSVSLSGLFNGEFHSSEVKTSLSDIARFICKGGWPGMLTLEDDVAALVPPQYIDTFVSSLPNRAGLSEYRIRRLLISLSRTLGQAVTYDTLASDMVEGNISDKRAIVNRQQVETLLAYLKSRFIIEDLNGWDAPISSKSRVRIKPKRSFVDPSLPATLLGANETRLLNDMQLFGKLFEELALRDLRILTSTMDSTVANSLMYYRDSDNLEVDAIIELRDGRWAAIEIKLGENKVNEAISSLLRLKKKVSENPLAQNREPSFMAVLLGKTDYCRQTSDGIYVIPITSLGA
jgi:predicted AAA+ superfamily ATPase